MRRTQHFLVSQPSISCTFSFFLADHQTDRGQNGSQALEDGAALGGVFPVDTRPDQVPQRLALYNKVRYARAVTVMIMSKTHDERRAEMLGEL